MQKKKKLLKNISSNHKIYHMKNSLPQIFTNNLKTELMPRWVCENNLLYFQFKKIP